MAMKTSQLLINKEEDSVQDRDEIEWRSDN